MNISDKKLPKNIEAEKTILGSLINNYLDIASEVFTILLPEDFFLDKHQKIFSIIREFYLQEKNIDLQIINNALNEKKQLDEIGGIEYLRELIDSVLSIKNIKDYIKIVKENAILRKLLIELTNIINDYLTNNFSNYNEFFINTEKRIINILKKREISDFFDISVLVQLVRHYIFALADKLEKGLTGVDSGFTKLNEYTNGFQKENLIVIAGRTGQGKTTFALNLILNAALNKIPVAIFEMEMSAISLYIKIISNLTTIPQEKILNGKINDNDKLKIQNNLKTLEDMKIYVDESSSLTIFDLEAKAIKLKEKEHNLGLIVIDYLGLISSNENNYKKRLFESRQLEIQDYTRKLHELARKLKLPIILLCQLNRKVDDRGGRPRLSDLRESGSIEQDADLVLFLYNSNDKNNLPNDDEINIIIAKNRNGKTGEFKLSFKKEYCKFIDLESKIYSNNFFDED